MTCLQRPPPPSFHVKTESISLLEYAQKNRNEGFFNDVNIKVNNEVFPVNRMVLSWRSPFFEKMFQVEMKERYERTSEVKGVTAKSMKVLIDYMYTEKLSLNMGNVGDILAGSDFLQMEKVKQLCFDFLAKNISYDNWQFILEAASIYRGESLLEQVYQFLSSNFPRVMLKDEFLELPVEGMISLLSSLDREQTGDAQLYRAVINWTKHHVVRKQEFPRLLQFINFDKLPNEFLEDVVSVESLILNNVECSQTLLKVMSKRLKKMRVAPAIPKIEKKENLSQNRNRNKQSYQRRNALLSIGGINTGHTVAEIHNLNKESASKLYPDLPMKLRSLGAVELEGYIYCVGGKNFSSNEVVDLVWRLNLSGYPLKWEAVKPLNEQRYAMGIVVFKGRIVVSGGKKIDDFNEIILASSESYDPTRNIWHRNSAMSELRFGHAMAVCDGLLYSMGGLNGSDCLSCVERSGNLNETWQKSNNMLIRRSFFAAVSCNGAIYVMGGKVNKCGEANASVEKYYPGVDVWMLLREMLSSRSNHTACVAEEKIFVVGGTNNFSIESYDPAYDSNWTVVQTTKDIFSFNSLVAI